ncbi:MAG: hypothetical protein MH321_08040 [Leptospiraceae bacterium]|nr:hypothetical protein [Leptospiraceae bacterium]
MNNLILKSIKNNFFYKKFLFYPKNNNYFIIKYIKKIIIIFTTFYTVLPMHSQNYTRNQLSQQDIYKNSWAYTTIESKTYLDNIMFNYDIDPSVRVYYAITLEKNCEYQNIKLHLSDAITTSKKNKLQRIYDESVMYDLYFDLFFISKEEFMFNTQLLSKEINEFSVVERSKILIDSLKHENCIDPLDWARVKTEHLERGTYAQDVKPIIYLIRYHANKTIVSSCMSQTTDFYNSVYSDYFNYPYNKYLNYLINILDLDKLASNNQNYSIALKKYELILQELKQNNYRPWLEAAIEYRLILICSLSHGNHCSKMIQDLEGSKKDYLIGAKDSYYRELLLNRLVEIRFK